ncbi:unnamed protein product [Lampetra fluviatilis]
MPSAATWHSALRGKWQATAPHHRPSPSGVSSAEASRRAAPHGITDPRVVTRQGRVMAATAGGPRKPSWGQHGEGGGGRESSLTVRHRQSLRRGRVGGKCARPRQHRRAEECGAAAACRPTAASTEREFELRQRRQQQRKGVRVGVMAKAKNTCDRRGGEEEEGDCGCSGDRYRHEAFRATTSPAASSSATSSSALLINKPGTMQASFIAAAAHGDQSERPHEPGIAACVARQRHDYAGGRTPKRRFIKSAGRLLWVRRNADILAPAAGEPWLLR